MRFKSNSTVGPPGLPVRIRTALLASPIIGPLLAKIFYHPLSREVLHEYWRRPSDGVNLPENYAGPKERSAFLVRIVSRYAKPDARILEIGCNVGRNLEYLFRVGFREGLTGIEISEEAVALMKETFPEMAANARIYNSPAEDIVKTLEDQSFDLVFTMAVLEHIHTSSEWLFHEIVRITRQYLVTIEDERGYNGRHFPRNYREILQLGFSRGPQALPPLTVPSRIEPMPPPVSMCDPRQDFEEPPRTPPNSSKTFQPPERSPRDQLPRWGVPTKKNSVENRPGSNEATR